ncbi:hypothetical protein SNEBB_010645 [Seison nebaliae]|nr:hypothetical protein SNEBB_010645 [Seison nebaliae]
MLMTEPNTKLIMKKNEEIRIPVNKMKKTLKLLISSEVDSDQLFVSLNESITDMVIFVERCEQLNENIILVSQEITSFRSQGVDLRKCWRNVRLDHTVRTFRQFINFMVSNCSYVEKELHYKFPEPPVLPLWHSLLRECDENEESIIFCAGMPSLDSDHFDSSHLIRVVMKRTPFLMLVLKKKSRTCRSHYSDSNEERKSSGRKVRTHKPHQVIGNNPCYRLASYEERNFTCKLEKYANGDLHGIIQNQWNYDLKLKYLQATKNFGETPSFSRELFPFSVPSKLHWMVLDVEDDPLPICIDVDECAKFNRYIDKDRLSSRYRDDAICSTI